MRKQWTLVGIIVALLCGGAFLGVRLAPEIFPVEVGSRAPDFHAVDLATGDSVQLSDYRGEIVLINIWATNCAPCRDEMPSIQRLYERYRDQGLRVLAVSVDVAGPDVVRAFQREFGLTFNVLHDRSGAIERIFQTTGVPESFVLNHEGRIVKKLIGEHDWASTTNRELIRRLLEQRG